MKKVKYVFSNTVSDCTMWGTYWYTGSSRHVCVQQMSGARHGFGGSCLPHP